MAVFRFLGLLGALAGLAAAQASGERVPVLLAPDEDVTPAWVRTARDKAFNVRSGVSMIDPDPGAPEAPLPHSIIDFMPQPELPYAEADTVVFGNITNLQPFLSADGKGLYTEYKLKVIETLKNAAPVSAIQGDFVTLLRGGGTARFAGGRVVRHDVENDVKPAAGRQYLAFLQYRPQLEGFYYTKLWLVEGDALKPLFPDDVGREHNGKSEWAGKPLRDVLAALKARGGK